MSFTAQHATLSSFATVPIQLDGFIKIRVRLFEIACLIVM